MNIEDNPQVTILGRCPECIFGNMDACFSVIKPHRDQRLTDASAAWVSQQVSFCQRWTADGQSPLWNPFTLTLPLQHMQRLTYVRPLALHAVIVFGQLNWPWWQLSRTLALTNVSACRQCKACERRRVGPLSMSHCDKYFTIILFLPLPLLPLADVWWAPCQGSLTESSLDEDMRRK